MTDGSKQGVIWRMAVVAALVAALCAVGAWWRSGGGMGSIPDDAASDPGRPAENGLRLTAASAPEGGYVGSAVCAECHADVSAEYQSHPMAHSMAPVLEAEPLERYGAASEFNPTRNVFYRAESDGTRVVHHERRVAADGQEIYDQGVEVHYAVGSGVRGRSYLINRDGRLVISPLTWYSRAARWDLAPGYDPVSHPRFERRASDACLSCHAGRVEPVAGEPNRFHSPPLVEAAIGCERCHGPGQAHVAHRSGVAVGTGVDPIVNPARLPAVLRDAVCSQCHLQGEWRVTRLGRSDYDFRPGRPLGDVWTAFLKPAETGEEGEIAIVSQVEQMLASACYRQSDGALGCVSCHDPHSRPDASERNSYYRGRCVACHSGADSPACAVAEPQRRLDVPDDSCIDCHMPALKASDVPHTAQTDHRVLRAPAAPRTKDPAGDDASREAVVTRVFVESGFEQSPVEVRRARAVFLALQADLRQDELLAHDALRDLTPLIAANPGDVEVLVAAGRAFSVADQPYEAWQCFGAAIALQPRHEDALALSAIVAHESRNLLQARDVYLRLIEVNPTRAEYYGRAAHVLGQLNQLDDGIRLAEQALELNPSLVQSHAWLAEVFRARGDMERTRRHSEMVEKFRLNR